MKDAYVNVVLIALAGAALAQLYGAGAPTSGETEAWISAQVGQRIDPVLIPAGDSPEVELDSGRCTFVVIASSTCGASVTLASQWRQDLTRTPALLNGTGWRVIWIVVDGENAPAAEMTPGVATYTLGNASEFLLDIGLRAYPSHIVVDREGKFVQGSVGGEFPTPSDLSEDCTLDYVRDETA